MLHYDIAVWQIWQGADKYSIDPTHSIGELHSTEYSTYFTPTPTEFTVMPTLTPMLS